MFERMLQRTCVIRHRDEDDAVVNAYGDPEIDTTETESPCELQQVSRSEPDLSGEMSVTTWVLFLPANTTIDTTDQVVIDDLIFEVVGAPDSLTSTFNRWGFVEATLVRTGSTESS